MSKPDMVELGGVRSNHNPPFHPTASQPQRLKPSDNALGITQLLEVGSRASHPLTVTAGAFSSSSPAVNLSQPLALGSDMAGSHPLTVTAENFLNGSSPPSTVAQGQLLPTASVVVGSHADVFDVGDYHRVVGSHDYGPEFESGKPLSESSLAIEKYPYSMPGPEPPHSHQTLEKFGLKPTVKKTVHYVGDYSFAIPGLGHSGPKCLHQRLSHFSDNGSEARFSLLHCKRIECPNCWTDWKKRLVFDVALRVEAYARSIGKRPYSVIMSVPPDKVRDRWSWDLVNTSLFRRGIRRGKTKAGITGGYNVFHPYRIRPNWKAYFRFRSNAGDSEAKWWDQIRQRVQDGESLYKFVELSPHVHGIVFGDPRAHSSNDFFIGFDDDEFNNPKEMELLDVVKYLQYLISHTGVITHQTTHNKYAYYLLNDDGSRKRGIRFKEYCDYKKSNRQKSKTAEVKLERVLVGVKIRKQVTHTIREFGVLFRFDPKKAFVKSVWGNLKRKVIAENPVSDSELCNTRGLHVGRLNRRKVRLWQSKIDCLTLELASAEFDKLCSEIAGMIGMEWVNGELRYAPSSRELGTSDAGITWVSIHKLSSYMARDSFLNSLSYSQAQYWFEVLRFMDKTVGKGRPPELDEVGSPNPPGDVKIFAEVVENVR